MLSSSRKCMSKLWSISMHAEALCSGAVQSCSFPTACSLPVCLQSVSLRGYANGADIQSSRNDSDPGRDYAELRTFLEDRNSIHSPFEGSRRTLAELPTGGGLMPEVPKVDTPTSRLLGRKGYERLTELRSQATTGNLGAAVSAAIQDVQYRSPRRGLWGSRAGSGDLEDLMDQWDDLLKQDDQASVSQQMQARPRDVQRILAALSEAEEKAAQAAQKEMRRQREAAIKAAHAAKRVRTVDDLGRAYGTGKRKTSIARVWIKEAPASREGLGRILVNGRRFFDYFGAILSREDVLKPMEVTDTLGKFDLKVNVTGGGITGQSQAIRHGLSKALQNWDPEHRQALKASGFLTRDSRIVERKKPGKAKARKSFQWVKR